MKKKEGKLREWLRKTLEEWQLIKAMKEIYFNELYGFYDQQKGVKRGCQDKIGGKYRQIQRPF